MAKVIMDSKCHQAIREEGTEDIHYRKKSGQWKGKRLTGLRDALITLGHNFDILSFEKDNLNDASVLIIAGRCDAVPFLDSELDKVASFSQNGGGILLMANHPMKFVSPQNQIVDRLNLPILFLMDEGQSKEIELLPHEISESCDDLNIRTFCRLSVSVNPLITIIAENSDKTIGEFAVAIEAGNVYSRIVAVGSSGHISSFDDSKSDLFSSASNAKWTLNTISWLQDSMNNDT
jgi:hypothetical protein